VIHQDQDGNPVIGLVKVGNNNPSQKCGVFCFIGYL